MDLSFPLAYIASRRPIYGKKAFQKLAYFSSVIGLPVRCSFSMHLYGPYSNEVAIEHSDMISSGLLFMRDGYVLDKGTSLDEYLEKNSNYIERYSTKLETLVNLFGTMAPRKLELYATTHFLASSAIRIGKKVQQSDVIRDVRKAKGNKFSREEVGKAFDDLVAWKLLQVE